MKTLSHSQLRSGFAQDDGEFDLSAAKSEMVARIREAIRSSGGNQAVAAKSGVPIGTINNWVRGVNEPKATALGSVAAVCSVSLDWLVYGHPAGAPGAMQVQSMARPELEHVVMIPRYDIAAAAGAGSLVDDGPPAEHIPIAEILLRGVRGNPKNFLMIEVAGDSMEPTLPDGAPILVDRSIRTVSDGVYVFRLDGQLSVKRLQLTGRSLSIMSDNPVYPSRDISGHDLESLKVLGKVIWPLGK